MLDDMNDIEKITWIELRFGLAKSIGNNPSTEQMESIENELVSILNKYREELKITSPIPRIRIWLNNGRLNFMFFDRRHGKRVLLGQWLSNKDTPYER